MITDPQICTRAHLDATIARVSFECSCLDMGWQWEAEEVDRGDRDPPRDVRDEYDRNGVWGTCVDCPRVDGEAYPERCEFFGRRDHKLSWPFARGWRIRCSFRRPDRDTGTVGAGFGRWWLIERDTTESAVIKTMFAAAKMIVEHELMEAFKVDGKRPFDPHRSIQDLVATSQEGR